jgi:hypothetical protein
MGMYLHNYANYLVAEGGATHLCSSEPRSPILEGEYAATVERRTVCPEPTSTFNLRRNLAIDLLQVKAALGYPRNF